MKKLSAVLVFLVVFMNVTAFGFDGKRKGFVLGGGLGVSPASKWEGDPIPVFLTEYDETKAALAAQVVIGYAWNEHNMLVYEGNITAYNSDFIDATITQGFNGASWYHYYGRKGNSLFTAVGVGFYVFDFEFTYNNLKISGSNDPAFGALLGAGFEFTPHFQIGGYLSFGKTTEPKYDYEHAHFSIIVSGVAF